MIEHARSPAADDASSKVPCGVSKYNECQAAAWDVATTRAIAPEIFWPFVTHEGAPTPSAVSKESSCSQRCLHGPPQRPASKLDRNVLHTSPFHHKHDMPCWAKLEMGKSVLGSCALLSARFLPSCRRLWPAALSALLPVLPALFLPSCQRSFGRLLPAFFEASSCALFILDCPLRRLSSSFSPMAHASISLPRLQSSGLDNRHRVRRARRANCQLYIAYSALDSLFVALRYRLGALVERCRGLFGWPERLSVYAEWCARPAFRQSLPDRAAMRHTAARRHRYDGAATGGRRNERGQRRAALMSAALRLRACAASMSAGRAAPASAAARPLASNGEGTRSPGAAALSPAHGPRSVSVDASTPSARGARPRCLLETLPRLGHHPIRMHARTEMG